MATTEAANLTERVNIFISTYFPNEESDESFKENYNNKIFIDENAISKALAQAPG